MAEVIDAEVEQGEIEAVEQEIEQQEPVEQKQPESVINDILPAKFRGKTPQELAKIISDQDSMIGRQAQEVGEVRRLADELLKSQLNKPKAEPEKAQEVDFFENPQEAIRRAIANSPDVLSAKRMAIQMQQTQAKQTLVQKHPDFTQVVKDGEFAEWVKSSKIRTQLFNQAEAYDVDAADELLSTFKQLRASKQQQVTQKISEVESHARDKTLQAVSVDTGGTGESSKKIYTRAKLLEMQLRRPNEYSAFADSGELSRAYLEGRVR